MRMLGRHTKISFIGPDGPLFAINRVKSFDTTFLGEIITEEYVDEDTPDFDEADMGVKIAVTFHPDDPSVLKVYEQIINRRKRDGDSIGKFSAASTYNFRDSGKRRVIIPNLFFGDLPLKSPSFKEFVSSEIEMRARKAYFKTS